MTKKQWVGRFGTYFLGVAIGLVMVALIVLARSQAMARQGAPPLGTNDVPQTPR